MVRQVGADHRATVFVVVIRRGSMGSKAQMRRRFLILILLPPIFVLAALLLWRFPGWWRYYRDLSAADRAAFAMDRRGNLDTRFYGLVVDQDGKPLSSTNIEVEISAFNENWAYEKERERMTYTPLTVVSDSNGRFEFGARGNYVRIKVVSLGRYRWLYDTEIARSSTRPFAENRFFRFATDGKPGPYLSNPASPAIFVMIREGVNEVRAKPSRGGEDLNRAYNTRIINQPVWPYRPSLKDVRYVGPTTLPIEPGN